MIQKKDQKSHGKTTNKSLKLNELSRKDKRKPSSNKNSKKSSNKTNPKNKSHPQRCRKRNSSSKSYETETVNNKLEESPKKLEPQQCLGPECTKEAIDKSKYCSEDCGLNLAKNRLITFLKSRIEQYNESPSYSKILNDTELERINKEIANLRIKLKELEQKHDDLDNFIDQAKHKTINANIEVFFLIKHQIFLIFQMNFKKSLF